KILDDDHDGLKDVKDRIIEFLALCALKGSSDGSILLFVGPPGVGKTSIGKSIAKALNRPFYRLSLGGVGDDSVIKGHRKTYIGAMPGKFVQALRETEAMNPVIMLDEIDKLTKSYNGDPASALLETLDPEQNSTFMDDYLDERLDLSKCLFICTANTTDTIPPALLDRMDPIRLSGYISQEKLDIAKHHLLPKSLEKAHMKKSQLKISDAVLKKIIEEYARESGMRSTERAIDRIVRKAAVKIIGGANSVTVKANELFDYLGTAPFKREKHLEGIGVITGLAWTSVGGATLPIESSKVSSDAKGFELTGSLGDVMKESAHIAYSFIQSHLDKYCASKKDFFKKATIHIHVPEGATPKDGPSAGVTLASSLLSLAMNKAPKKGYAMTGELSLTGQVLAIGGIREKTIAARRMGIKNIICPKANADDVKELPKEVTDGVNYFYADTFDDVANVIFDGIASKKQPRQ
ncbi:MAG: endopeptidase La, partial [Succinivibrio sp.]